MQSTCSLSLSIPLFELSGSHAYPLLASVTHCQPMASGHSQLQVRRAVPNQWHSCVLAVRVCVCVSLCITVCLLSIWVLSKDLTPWWSCLPPFERWSNLSFTNFLTGIFIKHHKTPWLSENLEFNDKKSGYRGLRQRCNPWVRSMTFQNLQRQPRHFPTIWDMPWKDLQRQPGKIWVRKQEAKPTRRRRQKRPYCKDL